MSAEAAVRRPGVLRALGRDRWAHERSRQSKDAVACAARRTRRADGFFAGYDMPIQYPAGISPSTSTPGNPPGCSTFRIWARCSSRAPITPLLRPSSKRFAPRTFSISPRPPAIHPIAQRRRRDCRRPDGYAPARLRRRGPARRQRLAKGRSTTRSSLQRLPGGCALLMPFPSRAALIALQGPMAASITGSCSCPGDGWRPRRS